MSRQYNISDLFITSWLDQDGNRTLRPEDHFRLLELRHKLDKAREANQHDVAGVFSILILRILRRNKSAVSKINVEQVVDCINDITFFREPWYFFPVGRNVFFPEPDEYMHDRTFEQLCYADSAFTKHLIQEKAKDHSASSSLDELIAVLYTAPEDFHPEHIADRTRMVRSLRNHQRFLILHTYANIREYIVNRCPTLFPKPSAPPTTQDQDPPIVHTGPMWRKLLYNFAETDAFKGYDRARNARIYEALEYLEHKLSQKPAHNHQPEDAHAKN